MQFHHEDNEESDQTARIWILVGCRCQKERFPHIEHSLSLISYLWYTSFLTGNIISRYLRRIKKSMRLGGAIFSILIKDNFSIKHRTKLAIIPACLWLKRIPVASFLKIKFGLKVNFYHPWDRFSRRQVDIFLFSPRPAPTPIFFRESRRWHYMQILPEMSKPIFWEKSEKNQNVVCWKIYPTSSALKERV